MERVEQMAGGAVMPSVHLENHKHIHVSCSVKTISLTIYRGFPLYPAVWTETGAG